MRLILLSSLILLAACSRESQGKTTDLAPMNSSTNQSNSPADGSLAQGIRQALLAATDLSAGGREITVAARDGVVTLRGAVPTADEKARIEALAQNVVGVRRVENLITVQ